MSLKRQRLSSNKLISSSSNDDNNNELIEILSNSENEEEEEDEEDYLDDDYLGESIIDDDDENIFDYKTLMYKKDFDFVIEDDEIEYEDGRIEKIDPSLPSSSSFSSSSSSSSTSFFLGNDFSFECETDRFHIFIAYILSSLIDPNFQITIDSNRREKYYSPSVRYFYDKLAVVAKSTFQSSIWKQYFVDNLDQFSRYTRHDWVDSRNGKCQICQKPHASTALQVKFFGRKYNPDEFKSCLAQFRNSQEDSGLYTIVYIVGEHCFYRSSRYHAIIHYTRYLTKQLLSLIQTQHDKYPKRNTQQIYENLLEKDSWIAQYYDAFQTVIAFYSKYDTPWYKGCVWWEGSF